jgi:hypothetical protein
MNPPSGRIDQTKFFLWMRIVAGTLALSMAALGALAHIHDLSMTALRAFAHPNDAVRLLDYISLVCFFGLYRVRQPGESRWVYLTNPRAFLTILAALSVLVTSISFLVRAVR